MAYWRREHRPLSAADREIRLLHIAECLDTSGSVLVLKRVLATVQRVRIDEAPAYFALSWTWGMPGRTAKLMIDGVGSVNIRENLELFLQALCRHFGTLTVWVDALCINQEDTDEKSSQVMMMMGEIYRRAERVYAWLGDGSSESDFAFQSMPSAVGCDRKQEFSKVSVQEQWQCFEVLFLNPYWTRLWTLQERVLARELWIVCGDWMAKWQDIDKRYVELQEQLRVRSLGGLRFRVYYSTAHDQYETAKYLERKELIDLVGAFPTLSCKDMRDQVYGLRDIATNGSELAVDYKKPVLHVLFDVLALSNPLTSPHDHTCMFEKAGRIFSSIPLDKEEYSPSEIAEPTRSPNLHRIHRGETDSLCQWVSGHKVLECKARSATDNEPDSDGQSVWSARTESRRYRCSRKVREGDWLCPLSFEGLSYVKWLYSAAAVFREDQEHQLEYVELVFLILEARESIAAKESALFWDQRDFAKSRPAVSALEKLWTNSHVFICSLTHPPVSGEWNIRLHFSRLAVLAHVSFGYSEDGEMPAFLLEVIDRSYAVRPIPPPFCQCIETAETATLDSSSAVSIESMEAVGSRSGSDLSDIQVRSP